MSEHMMDNFDVSDWCRITDCAMFNQIPFGVYAISEPTEMIPVKGISPEKYDRTVYFGKSGNAYDDFYYDRKYVKRKLHIVGEETKVLEKEQFHKYGLPARRLKQHRHNFMKRNAEIDREASYINFYESFGFGESVVSKINVCVITPKYEIPNHSVKAWLAAMESYLILRYQYNFGRNTLMNVDHDYVHNNRTIENSHASRRKESVKGSNLFRFAND